MRAKNYLKCKIADMSSVLLNTCWYILFFHVLLLNNSGQVYGVQLADMSTVPILLESFMLVLYGTMAGTYCTVRTGYVWMTWWNNAGFSRVELILRSVYNYRSPKIKGSTQNDAEKIKGFSGGAWLRSSSLYSEFGFAKLSNSSSFCLTGFSLSTRMPINCTYLIFW